MSRFTSILYISLMLNGVLVYQQWISRRPAPTKIEPGLVVPPIDARTLDGQRMTLNQDPAARPTMLYIFRPECQYCKKNLISIRELALATSARFRFVGLSLTDNSPAAYLKDNPLPFDVLYDPDWTTIDRYRLRVTPTTMLISPQGKILGVWLGTYSGKNLRSIEEAFSIRLPSAQIGDPAYTE